MIFAATHQQQHLCYELILGLRFLVDSDARVEAGIIPLLKDYFLANGTLHKLCNSQVCAKRMVMAVDLKMP